MLPVLISRQMSSTTRITIADTRVYRYSGSLQSTSILYHYQCSSTQQHCWKILYHYKLYCTILYLSNSLCKQLYTNLLVIEGIFYRIRIENNILYIFTCQYSIYFSPTRTHSRTLQLVHHTTHVTLFKYYKFFKIIVFNNISL